jgi:Tfp pilus assembly protein PilN
MSRSTKSTMILAVSFLLIAVALFGFVTYQVIAKGELLAEQAVALETQRIQEASYFRLIRQAEETTEKRAELKSYFLQKESDSIDFLTLVESIAPKAGVELETNKLDVLKEKGTKQAWIQTSFSFSGTREDVQNFVQILESLPYAERLTALEMNARSSELWQANVTMQVRVLSYDE